MSTLGLPNVCVFALVAVVGLSESIRAQPVTRSESSASAAAAIAVPGRTPSEGQSRNPLIKPIWESVSQEFRGFKAETRPKLDTTMQFSFGTEVREIRARGGDRVRKGDVLVRARDAEVVAAMEQQRVLANSDLEIVGSQLQLELSQFRFDQLKAGKLFSPAEFEELRIGAATAQVQRDLAVQKRDQARLSLKQLEGQFERFVLQAPFDGIIEELMVEVGQGVSEQVKILRIVNTDQLTLDAYADTDLTLRTGLKAGDKAWVLVDLPDKPGLVEGSILYVSPVADSVSQARRVRVEIENPRGWPAGTQAQIRFDAPGAGWTPYLLKVEAGPKTGASGPGNAAGGEAGPGGAGPRGAGPGSTGQADGRTPRD